MGFGGRAPLEHRLGAIDIAVVDRFELRGGQFGAVAFADPHHETVVGRFDKLAPDPAMLGCAPEERPAHVGGCIRRNCRGSLRFDRGGRGEAICDTGPVGYFATLPLRAITTQLQRAGITTEISNTAGTYICNRLFDGVMHHLAEQNIPATAGFVHLPLLHEQAKQSGAQDADYYLQILCDAVRITIECCLAPQ